MTSVALVGADGGELARNPRIDHCLVVENEQAGPVLACHLTIVQQFSILTSCDIQSNIKVLEML